MVGGREAYDVAFSRDGLGAQQARRQRAGLALGMVLLLVLLDSAVVVDEDEGVGEGRVLGAVGARVAGAEVALSRVSQAQRGVLAQDGAQRGRSRAAWSATAFPAGLCRTSACSLEAAGPGGSLPRALVAMRRHQHPGAAQQVVAAVRDVVEDWLGHGGQSPMQAPAWAQRGYLT